MSDPTARRSSRFMPIAAILLLFIGVQLWFVILHGVGIRRWQPLLIGIAAILAAIPPIACAFAATLDRIRHPSNRATCIASIALAIAACFFFYIQALYQHRTFTPKYHDEFSYLLQTRMIAHGQLWQPTHPLADFFDSFQILTKPVYASIYFPGSALLYAPSIWLHLPDWLIPLLISGAITGMIFYLFTHLIDGIAGALGVLMFISVPLVRLQTIMVMANVPTLLLAMTILIAWMHWRNNGSIRLAIVIGALAGWLFITRPLDGIAVILPIALASTFRVRDAASGKRLLAASGVAIVAALPFIAIQLTFDHRVTGHFFETPFNLYADQTFPGTRYGFHSSSATAPISPLPQKQMYYEETVRPLLLDHTPSGALMKWCDEYGPNLIRWTLPHSLFLLLIPVGLLGLRGPKRVAFFVILPLFVILYFGYVFFLPHYVLLVTPVILMLVALGVNVLSNLSIKSRPQILTFFVCVIALLSISEWPQFNRLAMDEWFLPPEEPAINRALASIPANQKAIVLFHFGPHSDTGFEPVYNTDVVWPDDARIIRAHDLGDRDVELFRYYADRQPDRAIYEYDRETGQLIYLDTAARAYNRTQTH